MFDITPAHLHLLVNHIPVIGIMGAVLLLVWAMIRNNAELKRAALIAFVLVGISAYVAGWTGEGAAPIVRHIPGIDRAKIGAHIYAANYAFYTSIILGVIALVGLILAWKKKENSGMVSVGQYVRHHKEPHKVIVIICLVVGLFDVYLLALTANAGGQIRHPEIVQGFQAPVADTTGHGQPPK
jgi:hypothetical protein